jgi:hypothetical protein
MFISFSNFAGEDRRGLKKRIQTAVFRRRQTAVESRGLPGVLDQSVQGALLEFGVASMSPMMPVAWIQR